MHTHPRYTDVSKLLYVENTYIVAEDASSFLIPNVYAERRIVNLILEYKSGEPPLEVRLPTVFIPYQKLTLNLAAPDPVPPVTEIPRRAISIRRKNTQLSLSWTVIGEVQESEGSVVIDKLHLKSSEDGRWLFDYDFDPTGARLDQINTLVVSGSTETELNGEYTKSKTYNGKPSYFSDFGTIIYDSLDGWLIKNNDESTVIQEINSSEHTQYPWETPYPDGVTITAPELSTIALKAPLYPDIEIFGTGAGDGVYNAVPKPANVASALPIIYLKAGTSFYLFKDTTNNWNVMNAGTLMTSARKQSDFPWETSYASTGTVVTRLDQVYNSPISITINPSPITQLLDARRLTELRISNMAGTSNPSAIILPGYIQSGVTFKGGAVTGDIVIIDHTQTAQNTTAEVRSPIWTGSAYTGTLTTLVTMNRTGRWVFRFRGGIWEILAVPQHTHPVGDLTQSGATTGQVIKWNGTAWAPGDDTGGAGGGVSWSAVPASPTATGTAGQMAYADNYLYVCVATNIWKRTILATWE